MKCQFSNEEYPIVLLQIHTTKWSSYFTENMLTPAQKKCRAMAKCVYLFYRWRSDFANPIDVVVNETLIIPPEAFCPQVRPTKVGIRILNSLHVRPLANYAKGNIQGNVLQLTKHFASEGLRDEFRNTVSVLAKRFSNV